ncbi:hypothetical protein [Micromonospora sp. DT47]|uniref:hypothetical protein n=1 Tax=Micromonospora sp. DT47 TaxID=3393431 RepID=UPI003CF42831
MHRWLRWYAEEGLDGLRDRSHRPRGTRLRRRPRWSRRSASCAATILGEVSGGWISSWAPQLSRSGLIVEHHLPSAGQAPTDRSGGSLQGRKIDAELLSKDCRD